MNMIAVETNILVYAHREDAKDHIRARSSLVDLANSGDPWAIPWPCVHEFLGVVTRPRYYDPPSTIEQAVAAISRWLESPSLALLHEGSQHFDTLKRLALRGQIEGAMIHDVRIAAICLDHGVSTLWTADRDFARFPELTVVNPLTS
jgi:toxin-antitoxin system PIN domain toxin